MKPSLRGKLMVVILATTVIALLTMTVALLNRDLGEYRRTLATDLATEADIMALLTAPALQFDDRKVAERNLSALSAKPAVMVAALYAVDGSNYASYVRAGAGQPPARVPPAGGNARRVGNRMEITRDIFQQDERIGVIYLSAVYDIRSHIYAYLGILGLMMLVALAVAVALSAGLRRTIIRPVEELASVADAIVTRRDPNLRAPEAQLEEFDVVARAFNSVLDEADTRARALEDSHKALRRSETLYRAIGESLDFGVWVCDATGRCTYASDSFLKLLGITLSECAGMGWSDMLHPDDVAGTVAAWEQCVRTGEPWYREHRFRGADGRYHPVLAQGVPILDEERRITGWAGINLDIRRMKETEDALREADRRKDDFLATLAHELRNPLAPIRHAAKLLGIRTLDPAQAQTAREIISRQVARMALLLDDLLEVSRITRGRLELRVERVSLNSVVKAAVETSRPLIESKRHSFSLRLPERQLDLQVDPLRMSQALSNLMTNAAKYTDPGGSIVVDIHETATDLVMSVQDSGIGLPATALPALFEMFSQVDSAIDRAEGGLGIGLALVKGLVGLHGGSVEAASAGPGKGSTFTMRIPRSLVHAAGVSASTDIKESAARGPRGRVLVVDDNRDAAASLAMILRSAGHTALVAWTGIEALEIAAREKPDVMVLDIGMPQMNGYEVARRIRQTTAGGAMMLIALTGWGQKEDVGRAIDAGFDVHMTKPADPERLEQLLNRFLASARPVARTTAENEHQHSA